MLKIYFKHILHFCVDILAKIFNRPLSIPKNIVIIRTDAIGDYILFRNFLEPLYRKYGKLTLVGNVAYQDIVENFDMKYLDEFIPIHRNSFIKNPIYRFRFMRKLHKNSYSILINPIYSRDEVSEKIAKIITAEEKIASIGDPSNLSKQKKASYDKIYTRLLPATQNIIFEFYRNLEFFEALLEKKLQIDLTLNIQNSLQNLNLFKIHQPYAVLFIGASAEFRKWKEEYFAQIGVFLAQTYQQTILICGGQEDRQNGELIEEELKKHNIHCQNLCGKTSLTQLASIVYNGNHLVSNETSCVHIAIAVRHNKVFVVYNGNHFSRFIPYPKEITKGYYPIYHPQIQKDLEAYKIFSNSSQNSSLDINEISPEMVIEKIQQVN